VLYQHILFQSKEDFKFHAAHFVAFEGYRERLHGHNYKVGVRLLGRRQVYHDGYVVDFGDIKRATRAVCKQLNEHFLCPMLSDVLTISQTTTKTGDQNNDSVVILCQDGSQFVFPKQDCAMLPIVHATAEELAVYLWSRILEGLDASYLTERGIHTMEVIVAEAVGQEAVFRLEIPTRNDEDDDENAVVAPLDVAQFVRTGRGQLPARPCPSAQVKGIDDIPTNLTQPIDCQPQQELTLVEASTACCEACQQSFSAKLERIAAALNQNKSSSINLGTITAQDLQQLAIVDQS
jgi:dihydroneopterin triphosphate aldolase (PTPS-III) / 6-pyruvoyltetrahydropterin synthase